MSRVAETKLHGVHALVIAVCALVEVASFDQNASPLAASGGAMGYSA